MSNDTLVARARAIRDAYAGLRALAYTRIEAIRALRAIGATFEQAKEAAAVYDAPDPDESFTAGVCDKCKKVVENVTTVSIQTSRQSHSSPAEYEEQDWCATCVNRAEYESDPDNAAYERALARGWAD